MSDTIGADEYKYYLFDLRDPNSSLTISLNLISGDAGKIVKK